MTPSPSPMLFDRQRRLLALLDVLGGRAGKLDFQKLLFLYCQDAGESAPYEFVPYRFGAFSFTSYADRRKLMDRGLLEEDEQNWALTTAGDEAVKGTKIVAAQFASFAKEHGNLRGDALLADTYRRFPYYATRSEIADRLLAGDRAALRLIEAARPARGPAGLSTIGYEGRSLENYLNELLRSGVTLLCDVRRNPLSRKYGFSKSRCRRAAKVSASATSTCPNSASRLTSANISRNRRTTTGCSDSMRSTRCSSRYQRSNGSGAGSKKANAWRSPATNAHRANATATASPRSWRRSSG